MSKKVVTLSLDEFNTLIQKIEEYRVVISKLNSEIEEYNKIFAGKGSGDAN